MAGTRQAGGDGGDQRGGQQPSLQLLEAIWQIFAEKKVVRMHTKVLLDALKKIEEAPWEEANNGREIDAYWLREKLKGFLPRPANPEEAAALRRSREWREGKGPPLKGYTEDHLREAWRRYLERKTPSETPKAAGVRREWRRGIRVQTSRPETAKDAPGLAADGADANGAERPRLQGERRAQRAPDRRGGGPARARPKPVGEA